MHQVVPGSFRPLEMRTDPETGEVTMWIGGEGPTIVVSGATEVEALQKLNRYTAALNVANAFEGFAAQYAIDEERKVAVVKSIMDLVR